MYECVREAKWRVGAQSSMQTMLLLLVDTCIAAASAPMIQACDLVTNLIIALFYTFVESFLFLE